MDELVLGRKKVVRQLESWLLVEYVYRRQNAIIWTVETAEKQGRVRSMEDADHQGHLRRTVRMLLVTPYFHALPGMPAMPALLLAQPFHSARLCPPLKIDVH